MNWLSKFDVVWSNEFHLPMITISNLYPYRGLLGRQTVKHGSVLGDPPSDRDTTAD